MFEYRFRSLNLVSLLMVAVAGGCVSTPPSELRATQMWDESVEAAARLGDREVYDCYDQTCGSVGWGDGANRSDAIAQAKQSCEVNLDVQCDQWETGCIGFDTGLPVFGIPDCAELDIGLVSCEVACQKEQTICCLTEPLQP